MQGDTIFLCEDNGFQSSTISTFLVDFLFFVFFFFMLFLHQSDVSDSHRAGSARNALSLWLSLVSLQKFFGLIPVLVGPGSPLGPGLRGRSQSVGGLHSLAGACWSRLGVTCYDAVTLCRPTAASAPAAGPAERSPGSSFVQSD